MSGTAGIDLGRGLVLRNAVGLASGTAGYGFEIERLLDIRRIGALYTKGTTRRPRAGNAPPRVAETDSGMLNSIGLQNPGVDVVADSYAPRFIKWGIPVVVNVAGADAEEYVHCVRRLDGVDGVAGIELNISCPNIAGGLDHGRDAVSSARLMAAVRAVTSMHVMVKLSPNVTDIAAVASALEASGADSLSAVNTYIGMKIDRRTGRPVLGQRTGGLSGPAIHPLALAAVADVVAAVRIPVVGVGGIDSVASAVDFLDVGAVAVQVGTANFVDPSLAARIVDELESREVRRTAVRLLLIDGDDRILLLHYRTPDTNEEFWCTPGGAMEPGESEQAAADRELMEEVGHPGVPLGPLVWQREHVFRIGDGRLFRQQEQYHLQRVEHFVPDMRRMGSFERAAVVDHRWWSVAELEDVAVPLQPPALATHLAKLLRGALPKVAVDVGV